MSLPFNLQHQLFTKLPISYTITPLYHSDALVTHLILIHTARGVQKYIAVYFPLFWILILECSSEAQSTCTIIYCNAFKVYSILQNNING